MAKWDKRKRLEATIAGEKCDRPPVALWRHWPGDDQDADALAAAHLKWQQDYDWDLVKVGPASSYSVIDWGGSDRWVGHIEGTREFAQRAIQQPEAWWQLKPLDPTRGMLATQIEALRQVGAGLDASAPFIATIFSPLSQAKHLAGQMQMLSHLRSHPEAVLQALEVITESTLRFIDAAKATGISGIFYAVQHARYTLMGRDEFSTVGRPFDERILQAVEDLWLNVVHVHGDEPLMFDLVADYPAQIFNWHDRASNVSLVEGLAQIQGAASGGVDHWTLHREIPQLALAEAREAWAQVNGRRLLLGTGCVIMATTPTRNIRALRQCAEDLGRTA